MDQKESGVLAILFFFGVIAVMSICYLLMRYYRRKRTEGMAAAAAAAAAELGLEFYFVQAGALSVDNPYSVPREHRVTLSALGEKLKHFDLYGGKMHNLMIAETELATLTIFDYRWEYYRKRTVHQTYILMQSDSLDLPRFHLKPEGFFEIVGAAFGCEDIDFDENPEFSQAFTLKGDDEPAIRTFFDREMLAEFLKHRGVIVETNPGLFIYYQAITRLKKPNEIRQFMTDGYAMYSAFAERLERSSATQE